MAPRVVKGQPSRPWNRSFGGNSSTHVLYRRLTPQGRCPNGTHTFQGDWIGRCDQRMLVYPIKKTKTMIEAGEFGREGSRRASAIGRMVATTTKRRRNLADDGSNKSKKEEATSSDIAVANMTRTRRMFWRYILHHDSFGFWKESTAGRSKRRCRVNDCESAHSTTAFRALSSLPVAAAMVPPRSTPRRMEFERNPSNGKLQPCLLLYPVKDEYPKCSISTPPWDEMFHGFVGSQQSREKLRMVHHSRRSSGGSFLFRGRGPMVAHLEHDVLAFIVNGLTICF